MRAFGRNVILFLMLLSILLLPLQAKLKVYISADMEGIAGIVSGEQVSPKGYDYQRARIWMTEEVNAAIEGALEAGATEIVVNDSHGPMTNIIASRLNPKALLITGSPKPLSMMEGIDSSFDAVIFIGYHGKAGTSASVLDHTYSGSSIYYIKVNGIEMPELGINAAVAGYYGVPVVAISGDSSVCRQAKELLGNEVVTIEVKKGIGRYAAWTLTPEKARKLIKEKVKEALLKRNRIKPFVLKPPLKFEISFLYSYQTEYPVLIPGVKRVNARTVAYTSKDMIEGFKLMRALIALARSK